MRRLLWFVPFLSALVWQAVLGLYGPSNASWLIPWATLQDCIPLLLMCSVAAVLLNGAVITLWKQPYGANRYFMVRV